MRARTRLSISVPLLLLPVFAGCTHDQNLSSGALPPPRVADPLPKLAPSDLPPTTRAKPDPAKTQYLRESIHVSIAEQIKNQAGEVSAPPIKVLEDYLKEYLRRSGHPIAADSKSAEYVLEGSLEVSFVSVLRVLDRVAGYKYRGSATLTLWRASSGDRETFSLPDLLEENVKSEESAVLNLRRRMAKLFWDQIALQGKLLSTPEVAQLLGSLAQQPGTGDTLTTEDVVRRVGEIGFPAVPYLLEGLTDNRIVRVPSTYPGFKGRNLDDLRVFHIADKALEEIFQKVSRMNLDIGAEDPASMKLRRVITKGWENEWRRFCKPYAESPNAPRASPASSSASGGPPPTGGAPPAGR